MVKQDILARYVEPLLRGDRRACRTVIEEALESGIPANSVYVHIVWPVMLEIEKLMVVQLLHLKKMGMHHLKLIAYIAESIILKLVVIM